jgi:hypothetical protein
MVRLVQQDNPEASLDLIEYLRVRLKGLHCGYGNGGGSAFVLGNHFRLDVQPFPLRPGSPAKGKIDRRESKPLLLDVVFQPCGFQAADNPLGVPARENESAAALLRQSKGFVVSTVPASSM